VARDPDRSEVAILERLNHRNIVKLYEELVVKFIQSGQIVDALIYLRSNGVIHRDLKPENIIMASFGTTGEEGEEDPEPPPEGYPTVPGISIYPIVKLADFGLSRVVSVFGRANTVVGTPQYWAPEVVRSRETGEGYD
ncbi:Serine/threonine-protein kinase pdik1l, partial [Perkinsus olseni]